MSDRRGFFSALSSLMLGTAKEQSPFYPHLPGYRQEGRSACSECVSSSCVRVCPESIVIREAGAVPVLDFSRRGCTFCAECAHACEHDLFASAPAVRIDAEVRIAIVECLAWNQTICRSCADVCNDRAIEFTGLFNPQINAERCSACGFCIGVCPGYAISVRPKESV